MWDQRYAEDGFAYGTAANDFLVEVCGRIPAGEVLEIASGEGRNAVYLAEQGFRVTGVDSSSVGVEKTLALAAERGVSVDAVVGDLSTWELGESRWSGIVAIFAHLPPPVRARVHRAAVAALAPGGALVMEVYGKGQLGRGTGGPPVAAMLYDLDELRAQLEGLDFEIAEVVERPIREGRYHEGVSEVVRLLGFKR